MPRQGNDEVITTRHKRNYIQFGGAGPVNSVMYGGQDAQDMVILGVTNPEEGKSTPIWAKDLRKTDRYRLLGRKIDPPDLAAASIEFLEKHGVIPKQLSRIGCLFNAYELTGNCDDLSDYTGGWSDYILIYSQGQVTTKDLGDRTTWDTDVQIADKVGVTWGEIYPVGPLSFADYAQSFITLEVIDAVYGSQERCANCGPSDDGTKRIYAITKSSGATPGTAPRLIYSVNGAVGPFVQAAVDGLGDIEDPSGIDIVGPYLVVYTRTAGGPTISGYYYAEINRNTGVPGTFTKVTSGFVASFQVYDMFVLSPREIFFSADGGYIYKSSDITAGVSTVSPGNATSTALRRIHGRGDVLVAVGGSGVTIISTNRGVNWRTTVGTPVVSTLQAVAVGFNQLIWVGAANGTIWYSLNNGETWTQKLTATVAGQITDIVMASDEVMYVAYASATPLASLFCSWDGGANLVNAKPRNLGIPVSNRINRISFPAVSDLEVACNNVLLAGLAGNGSDGFLYLGISPVK